jgi:adenylate cyclase
MTTKDYTRKLAAILSADVKGYSRLMQDDEAATVRTLTAYREVFTRLIFQHRGRVVDSPGDNILAEFNSVVDAVECAVNIQRDLEIKNNRLPDHRKMVFRIGINLGDVIAEEDRIYGDGVNIAARLEGLAPGGGICLSGTAYDQIENKLDLEFSNLGRHRVKNIARPVRVYQLSTPLSADTETTKKEKPKIAFQSKAILALSVVLIVCATALIIWNAFLTPDSTMDKADIDKMALPLPDKPSIAVLPFDNLTGDPGQEYIADGITETIIMTLSSIREMFVIARNSTFVYKGKPVKIQQVAEELGVRYVLEGSVQKLGKKIRITAQLIDATTGYHLWAKRYDRNVENLLLVQDEIALNIFRTLQIKLTEGEGARLWQHTKNFDAWGYFVKGTDYFERFSPRDNLSARKLFEKAVDKDPEYADAWTMLAWTYILEAWFGFDASIEKGIEAAKKAAALKQDQSHLHSFWSTLHLLQRDYEKAIEEGKKAVTLGPNNALCHVLFAYVMLFDGRFEEAVSLAEKAIRLTPYSADWYLSILGQAYRQNGQYKKARIMFEKALDRSLKDNGNQIVPLIGLTDLSVQLGQEEKARAYAKKLILLDPSFRLDGMKSIYTYRDPTHLERIIANLRQAGLK